MQKLIHVALALNLEIGYDRQVVYGVRDYLGARKPWNVRIIGTTRQLPSAAYDGQHLSLEESLRRYQPVGIIARLNSRHALEAVLPLGIKMVNVSGVDESLPVPHVGVDNVAMGRLAATHLMDRGLKTFACFAHSNDDDSKRRCEGFSTTIKAAGRKSEDLSYVDLPPENDSAAMKRWLADLPKPIGMYVDADWLALRVIEGCRELGIRVPEEISLVSNDNDELICEFAHPPISSVDPSARRIGYEAAALLEAILQGKPFAQEPLLLPPMGVVARQSSDVLAVDEPTVAQAVRFIREQATGRISVTDVVKHVGISRRWLERSFHRALGRSPLDEIRRVRVERAKELLARTDLPMPDIARMSGFSSAPRLSIVMQEQTGMPPTAYRRQFRLGRPSGDGTPAPR